MSNIAGNMSRSRSKGASVGGGNFARTLSDQSAVVGFITSWANLGTPTVDGLRKVYRDGSDNRIVLAWNNTDSRWEMRTTVGFWVTVDDFSGGAIDTDLWEIVTNDNSRMSVANSRLEFDVVSGLTEVGLIRLRHAPATVHSIRADMSMGSLSTAPTGDLEMILIQGEFDGDTGTSGPTLQGKHILQDDFSRYEAELIHIEEGQSFQIQDINVGLNTSTTYTTTLELTDDGSNTTGKVSLDTGDIQEHTFPASYAGNVVLKDQLYFRNINRNDNGTIWMDNFQLKIGGRRFQDWSSLKTGTQDGERVEYVDGSGNSAFLEWDSSLSQWVLVSTLGQWVTIDDFDGNSFNTDLWTVTDTTGRGSVSGGEFQTTVNAVDTGSVTLDCVFRCDMGSAAKIYGSLNGIGQPASGANEIRLLFNDFDEDADGQPDASLKYRYDFGQAPRMNYRWTEEGGSSGGGNTATSLNAADPYSWTLEITDDGSNATANYEAFDNGDVSVGSNSHVYPASYAGTTMAFSVLGIDSQTDVSGTLSVDRIQVKK